MDPAALAALISGITAATGAGVNAYQTGKTNKKSREFSREMFAKTQTANIEQWNRVNAYNAPAAQMARYRDAGLNPALMYGQGNSGNAGSIPTPDVVRPQFDTPRYGDMISSPTPLAYMSAMYDLDIKAAQADNLRAQNAVIEQDALLKSAQIERTKVGTDTGVFDLGFKTEMRDVSAEAMRENLRQTKVNIDNSIQRNAREAAMNSASVAEAFERMKNLEEQRLNMALSRTKDRAEIQRIYADADRIRSGIALIQKEGVLKDFEIALSKANMTKSDPMWSRLVASGLQKFFTTNSQSSFLNGLKEGIMSPFK